MYLEIFLSLLQDPSQDGRHDRMVHFLYPNPFVDLHWILRQVRLNIWCWGFWWPFCGMRDEGSDISVDIQNNTLSKMAGKRSFILLWWQNPTTYLTPCSMEINYNYAIHSSRFFDCIGIFLQCISSPHIIRAPRRSFLLFDNIFHPLLEIGPFDRVINLIVIISIEQSRMASSGCGWWADWGECIRWCDEDTDYHQSHRLVHRFHLVSHGCLGMSRKNVLQRIWPTIRL